MLLKQLEDMVSAAVVLEKAPTQGRVRELVSDIRQISLFKSVTDTEAEYLIKILETKLDVSMTIGAQLTAKNFKPWLESRRKDIDPYYWDRYRKLLVQQGLPPGVVNTLDEVTERITGLLEDPEKEGPWDRRGMVVGHVQSGKTANYTGVISKAADAGYRLIVVIAGVHNNLRSQTQARIDEGIIGRDTGKGLAPDGHDNRLGVGFFNSSRKPASFTSTTHDFNKQQAGAVGVSLDNLKEPAVLVIKKNSSTLANVIAWLKEHNAKRGTKTISAPMLLIDDEADNASINTAKGKGEVTKINGQLRELLRMFERSCYVGYTATPFANIFIDPDSDDEMVGEDLFPRDFIVSLDPPDNYFGARHVFIDNSEEILRNIDDNGDLLPVVHKKEHRIIALPGSLVEAIRAFVVARAIRILRGQGSKHSSMLVNASRFTAVQSSLRVEIHERLRAIKDASRLYGGLEAGQAEADEEIAALKRVWEREYSQAHRVWSEVLATLNESAAAIRVVEVNSKSKGGLDYASYKDTGLNVIAVGGFSLSRGLTLEGLIVSYFLRNSMMYDTLMQMGRWFGYRPGYDDLCRVWMPEEAQGWYEHIAEAIEELRDELRAMAAINATPREFGLKVRSHPDTLIITARNKMGTGKKLVMRIGLGKSFVETAVLRADAPALKENRKAATRLAQTLKEAGFDPKDAEPAVGGYLLDGVPVEPVLDFIRAFRNSEGSFSTETGPVSRYVEDRANDELALWQVLFTSVKASQRKLVNTELLGREINCQERTMGDRSNDKTIYVSNKQRVASRGVEMSGIAGDAIASAQAKYLQDNPTVRKESEKSGKKPNYPDWIYREVRARPLLIVHLLDLSAPTGAKFSAPEVNPIIAWSISFPETERPEQKVEYVVGAVWLKENMAGEWDDDDLGGDDD
ncbi:Z1 domain-containing protein [Sandarakinorhabdus oryzae]|uniref:Z1 domain-containing protein n=1 Tax=Sandarakinorhabdus oryzae TaxID=2675220 RepID=UPI0012E16F5B|nr:Z1 domain-containing protein [Sandarakinorhabdus oryzae]